MQQLGARTLSSMLLGQQLDFFGKLARRSPSCPVRQLIFEPDLTKKETTHDRRRGRPRLQWSNEMHRIAREMFDSENDVHACVVNAASWRKRVRLHCRAKPQ